MRAGRALSLAQAVARDYGEDVNDLSTTLRDEQRARETNRSAEERLALAFALGRRDLVLFAETNGITLREARLRSRALAQAGRAPSAVMSDPG